MLASVWKSMLLIPVGSFPCSVLQASNPDGSPSLQSGLSVKRSGSADSPQDPKRPRHSSTGPSVSLHCGDGAGSSEIC